MEMFRLEISNFNFLSHFFFRSRHSKRPLYFLYFGICVKVNNWQESATFEIAAQAFLQIVVSLPPT